MDFASLSKNLKFLLSVSLSLLLTACGILNTFGTDNAPAPTPLSPIVTNVSITPLWSLKQHYQQIAYHEGIVFAANAKNLMALNANTGQVQWKVPLGVQSHIAVSDDLVVVGANQAEVVALRTRTGEIVWRASVSDQVLATPCVTTNVVLVRTVNDALIALDARTGHERWTYDHHAPSLVLQSGSAPQVSNGIVVVGFADGWLSALDIMDGKIRWEQMVAKPKGASEVERMVDIDADPVLADGVVYIASYQGAVAALSLPEGRVLWRHKKSSYQNLALDAQTLYVVDAQSRVWAFDRRSGKKIWYTHELAARRLTRPVMIGKWLFVGDTEGYIHALSSNDGHLIGRLQVQKSSVIISLVNADRVIYALTNLGLLSANTVS